MAARLDTRQHLLIAMGDIEGLTRRLTSDTTPMPDGLRLLRVILDRRAFLETELKWADNQSVSSSESELSLLTGYRLLVIKALVLTERTLSLYPTDNSEEARAAGEALVDILSLRVAVEDLPE